jgi:hypothetical protein
MVTLSGALLKDLENVDKRVSDAKNLVNVIRSLASFDSVTGSSVAGNLANLRTLENNMLSAVLLGQQAGQSPQDVSSSDGTFAARAQKVLLQDRIDHTVSVQSPVLPGSSTSSAKFDLNFNANRVSDVSVRSSVQPKSKWDKLATSVSLLSDLIDCTVIKDGSVVGTASAGFSRAGIELEFPLSQGTGAGSSNALDIDKSSFRLMFIDSNGQLSSSGCFTTDVVKVRENVAKYTGYCDHLTVLVMGGSTPSAAVTPPILPGPVLPVPPTPPTLPTPVAPPAVTASPSSEEPPATFPVWASVLLAAGGAVIVAGAAVIIKKRREAFENERVKKIVAASLWKQAYASTSPTNNADRVSPRASSPQRYSSPAFSAIAVPGKLSPPLNSTTPLKAVLSASDMSSEPSRRRQILADLAGAIEVGELGELGEGSSAAAFDNQSRSRQSPSPVKFLADLIELDEAAGVPVLKPFGSRSRSPFNRNDSRDVVSSLNISSSRTLRDSGITSDQDAFSPPTSVHISSPEGLSGDLPAKSRALPRHKSPRTPSNADDAQLFSSFTSPARRDPVASSLRQVGGKTVRQQLANMAAAAAEVPSQEFALPPFARSSPRVDHATELTRARSSSRGRVVIPDLQASPGLSVSSPSVPRTARQLMADVAAGEVMGQYAPRNPSPIGRDIVPASRLPRSRSRPILADPDTMHTSTSPSASSISRNASPRDSRLSPSSLRQPASRDASRDRGVSALPDPMDAAPRAGSSKAPAGFSARKPSQPSRQGGGNRYDQA